MSPGRAEEPVAFYCMSSDVYFLGAVGLVNSLRLVGHREPIYLLDCGLTDEQRSLLEAEARIVEAPLDAPPFLLKAYAPNRHPAGVRVLVDADIVVCRPLTHPIEQAAPGRVVAGATGLDRHRVEWGELLGLGTVRRMPYLSSALMALGGDLGGEVIRLVDERSDRVDFERTYFRANDPDYPLLHAEEDVINAVIGAAAEGDEVIAFEPGLSPFPPFHGVRVTDERTLRCRNDDGTEPYVLHHWLAKPWLEPTHEGPYSQLLRRLLIGDDVPVRVPEDQVPSRFRAGPRAWAERKLINFRERRQGS